MATRVNITIPDDLYEQLQQVKDAINISGVCQEALYKVVSMEIAKMNVAAGVMSKREAAIARLKMERKQSEDAAYTNGKTQGSEDAADLDYDSFKLLEEITQDESLPPHFQVESLRRTEAFEWLFGQIKENEVVSSAMEERYVEGWIVGALEFWDDVKSDVLSSEQEQVAEVPEEVPVEIPKRRRHPRRRPPTLEGMSNPRIIG